MLLNSLRYDNMNKFDSYISIVSFYTLKLYNLVVGFTKSEQIRS